MASKILTFKTLSTLKHMITCLEANNTPYKRIHTLTGVYSIEVYYTYAVEIETLQHTHEKTLNLV